MAPGYFPQPQFAQSSTAYTLRFAGTDRFATAGEGTLVAAINQKTTTGWPFNEGDPLSPAKAYGAGACPKTVFIVASDGLPDALAASALRGLAALTLSSHVYSTANALLLLTDTARPPANATTLNDETKVVLTAVKATCGNFDAIVLGGPAAVATGVETDLGAYAGTVGRIAGVDRYDTAGQIASAVNSVSGLGHVNYYADNSSGAAAKSGAVFLAEGTTGADALSVGPIAADTNTPVLLTSGGSLAGATAAALAALKPANIFVLGGQAAVPDAVASMAKTAAGSSNAPIRISGPTRYATSVALAEQLDNLWPQNATNQVMQDQNKFVNQGFGLARSEGSGLGHVGWPDALSSGLVLASLHSGTGTVPLRLAPPVEANPSPFAAASTLGGTAGPSRFPLLLTPGAGLAPEVDAYLKGLYPVATRTASTPATADQGGFGYVFGGQAAILPTAELTMAQDLSGGTYTAGAKRSDLAPTLDNAGVYYTAMDLTGYRNTVTGEGGITIPAGQAGAGDKLCLARGAAAGVQNLDIFGTTGLLGLPNGIGYEVAGPYSPGKSVPMCFPAAALPNQTAQVLGVSLSGSVTGFVNRSWSTASSVLRTDALQPATACGSTATVVNSETPLVIGNIDNAALP
ncbi:MAG TPA: cell wall-binding repeat-containing protein, partial [Acidimicrobiales bacterium]|nr:cell wall-binding repeat-containing protein [Acidimicrobiales bacterium]